MNVLLWILQVLLTLAFLMVGFGHAFNAEQMKNRSPQMAWIGVIPKPLMTFIGICEMLGAVGLILPLLTGILPVLTGLAALGLSLIMLFAAIFHFPRKEYQNMVANIVLMALAAFVAYGRLIALPS